MRPYPILTLGWATLLVGGLAIQRHFQERDAWPASADLGHPSQTSTPAADRLTLAGAALGGLAVLLLPPAGAAWLWNRLRS
jgi:hypothetical protein